jgi:L-lysine epsilon oxidase-like protein
MATDLIQFRVHPGVGMARFGESTDWYFLGPEIPRFLQEQYPNLRHRPRPLKHPFLPDPAAELPADGKYRDKKKKIMPQAARFRVYAYFFDRGTGTVYRVMEITTTHADIEWRVELANVKGVKVPTDDVDPNQPFEVELRTKTNTPAMNCRQDTGLPNLAYLALEKDSGGTPNGRLHVIGNEGEPTKRADATFKQLEIFQDGWQDNAADGTVRATIELKPAFTSQFAGYHYLGFGQAEPNGGPLPADRKVEALPATVVVNMPDYVPDMGHFVSLWDLGFAQARRHILENRAKEVPGRHRLAVKKEEVSSYDFFDYYTHIHPLLGTFSDVPFTSGQARAGAIKDQRFLPGVRIKGILTGTVAQGASTLDVDELEAMQLKVASRGEPFLILLSEDDAEPLQGKHEFVRCTAVHDETLDVTRGEEGTADVEWSTVPHYRAATKAGFVKATLAVDMGDADVLLAVDMQSVFKMPLPLLPDETTVRDGAFKVGIRAGGNIEWMTCTVNRRVPFQRDKKVHCNLVVTRGVDGTTAREWLVSDDPDVIATAIGHGKLDPRSRVEELSQLPGPAIARVLFSRLRKPKNVYARTNFRKLRNKSLTHIKETPFPREFGRRIDFDAVSKGSEAFDSTVNIDPAGSLARYHEIFVGKRSNACLGEGLTPDPDTDVPPILADETDPPNAEIWGTGPLDHANRLDDYYWIVSEADMPMLKEYALTEVQYGQFARWANQKLDFNPRWAPLFDVVFKGSKIEAFFKQGGHTLDQHLTLLLTALPLYAPAFLDMASLGKMLGGSFLPGIEVGREAGRPENWSLFQGGTKYFPDLRLMPQGTPDLLRPGALTKDLGVPWFVDFEDCQENYWPTSRPQVVYQEQGLAYSWLPASETADEATITEYWKRVGFIRRRNDGTIVEDESIVNRP